ncbi:MAG TPA: YegS/Rv2252/BmrU family lipid kinase [Solirubrobacteraceae bacterium]|nr:YegS/Rv2252/BmrU family lipid kinase [Solirubrobacteraceae bacterium]
MPARVCLIVNPAAGGGRAGRAAPACERALRGHGLQLRREDTRGLQHARELAGAAADLGETVVALGGDGLIGAIADRLRERPRAVLGIIPGGRGNDLARVLGIPEDAEAAAEIIAAGHTLALDLGFVEELGGAGGGARRSQLGGAGGGARRSQADGAGGAQPAGAREPGRDSPGRAFVGIASAGFDSDANRIANEAPARLGQLVYVYGALRALLAWRAARFQIELEPPGERHTYTGFSVGAANSKAYGGGMWAAPDALLDDGLLEVVLVEDMSRLAFLTKILPKVFKGTHVHEPGVHVFRARELVLEADRPFTMYADGDPIGQLPVRVRALPAAITMLTPASREPLTPSAPGSAFGARARPAASAPG